MPATSFTSPNNFLGVKISANPETDRAGTQMPGMPIEAVMWNGCPVVMWKTMPRTEMDNTQATFGCTNTTTHQSTSVPPRH